MEKARNISLDYNFVTPLTSLVVVVPRPDTTTLTATSTSTMAPVVTTTTTTAANDVYTYDRDEPSDTMFKKYEPNTPATPEKSLACKAAWSTLIGRG